MAEPAQAQRYRKKVAELKEFLAKTPKKCGPSGNEQKINLTDPESAKMASSRGVIQGYNGLAVVGDKNQIVVHADAHGTGYEAHLLAPLIEATRKSFADLESGWSDKKERALERRKQRETREPSDKRRFTVEDFTYDELNARCICPAGKKLYCSGKDMLFNGYRVSKFKAPIRACRGCPLRQQVPSVPQPDTPAPNHHLSIVKDRRPNGARLETDSPFACDGSATHRVDAKSTAAEWAPWSPCSLTSRTRACVASRFEASARSARNGNSSRPSTTSKS